MSKLNTLNDGLLDGLKDIHSAEHQLIKVLPKMEKKASSAKLKTLFSKHLKETEGQILRLQKIESLMEVKLTGKTCKAMQGLIEEGKEVLAENSDNEALIDAMLVGAATRVEHYEMAAYKNALTMALELGEDKVAKLLEETLTEETAANDKLVSLSVKEVLVQANCQVDQIKKEIPPAIINKDISKKILRSANVKLLMIIGLMTVCSMNFSMANAETDETVDEVFKNESMAKDFKTDNTGRNVRDVNEDRKTADEQSFSGDGMELLAQIRRKIVAKDSLSTYSKNIKIVVDNGMVILRGPVGSIKERTWIEEATVEIAPNYKVINQLEVAAH